MTISTSKLARLAAVPASLARPVTRCGAMLFTLAVLCVLAAPARAADIVKANNATGMATGSSWVGNAVPTASDTAVFDSTLTSSVTSFGTGGIVSVLGVRVTTGSTLVNIDNSTVANYFGAFGGGIDMSAASRDLRVTSFQQQADHTWNVATGRTLTIGDSSGSAGFGRFAQANGSVLSLVGGGTISISRATAAISLGDASSFTGNLATNGTTLALVADTAESITFGGTLSGTTTISKSGAGTYELPGAKSLGSSVTVSAGTLVLSGTNTFSGSALTKAGAGSLLLTAANSYTGLTTISAGTLQVGDGATTGSIGSGNIVLSQAATLVFDRSDDVSLSNQWNSLTGGGTQTLRNDGTGLVTLAGSNNNIGGNGTGEVLVLAGSGNGSIEQSFASGGADLGIRKEGSGTWTLTSNSNGYSGTTTISEGTLQIGNGGSTGTIGVGDIQLDAGATLAFNRTAPLTVANDWISFTDGGVRTLRNDGTGKITLDGGNIGLSSGTTTLALVGSGDGEIAQSIAAGGAAISIVKEGTGTWTLSNAATNYSGTTTITAGTLEVTGLIGAGAYAQAIANDGELHINSASAQTLSGAISGAGLLRKSAAGTLTLSGTNTYTGGTTLAGGTLALGSADALGSTGTITLSGGTLQFSASNTTDYSARFATSAGQAYAFDTNGQTVTLATALASTGGTLTKSGTGTLVLSATNTYDGTTTVSAGTLRIVDGGSLGTGTISVPDGTLEFTRSTATSLPNQLFVQGTGSSPALLNNGSSLLTIQPGTSTNIQVDNGETFTVGGSGDIVIEKSIASGAGASLLTKTGSGTVTLTSPLNNWSGGTTISAGVLQVGDGTSDGTIGSGTLTITNGRLAFNRPNPYTVAETIANFQDGTTPGIENNGAGLLTVNAANLGFAVGASGITLTLGGTGNGLMDGPIASGGAAANIAKDGTGTWTFDDTETNYSGTTTISAGTLEITGRLGNGSYSRAIANAATLHFNSASAQTLSGVISGAGLLEKSNSSTLTLSAANTYSGDTTINAGTLLVSGSGSLGSGSYAGAITNDGTLEFATSANQTLSGAISGSGDLVKGGSGTLTISGAFSLAGDISLPNGTLEFTRSTATSLPNQLFVTGTGSAPALVNNGSGLLTIQSGTSTNIQVDNGETFTVGGNGDIVIEKSIASGAGASLLTKTGSGTVTLTSADNNWSGGTTISAGVLQVGDGTSDGTIGSGTITITNGRLAFNRANAYTVAETIADFQGGTTPGIENNGVGLLTVDASNLGFAAAGIPLTLGGTGDGLVDGPIAVAGAAANIVKDGSGTWTFNSATTNYSGTTTVSAGTLEITGRLGQGSYAQTITNDATLRFNSTSTQTLSGVISGAGTLVKSNTGTVTLSAANTFTGLLRVEAGTLAIGGSGSLAATVPAEVNGGILDIAGKTQTISALNGTGGTVALGAGSLSIANASANTYAGSISGTGSLVKSGAGDLVLSGANTYTGATSVAAGRLSVNGSLANTAVTVAGGELGGAGSIIGSVTVQNGGRLAPGNSIASLAAGATSFDAGATFAYEVDSTNPGSLGSAADLLVVSGNLSIASGTLLEFTDLASSVNAFPDGTRFALINYTGSWDGGLFTYGGVPLADGDAFFVGLEEWQIDYNASSGGVNFTGDYLPNSSFVTVTAVPEPGTLALLAAAAGLAALAARRRGT